MSQALCRPCTCRYKDERAGLVLPSGGSQPLLKLWIPADQGGRGQTPNLPGVGVGVSGDWYLTPCSAWGAQLDFTPPTPSAASVTRERPFGTVFLLPASRTSLSWGSGATGYPFLFSYRALI